MRWWRMREQGEEFDMGLPRGTALACMSETMVLGLENRLEPYTLGRGIDNSGAEAFEAGLSNDHYQLIARGHPS